jgi:triosephosphate isomerase
MRRPLVVGNWKMHGTLESVSDLLNQLKDSLADSPQTDFAVCPPSVFLLCSHKILADTDIAVGAQNLSHKEAGAFTGEISAEMLTSIGCTYVIVGHSERRALYGETDELVAAKVEKALEAGLTPILCVGESLEERESGVTLSVIGRQLQVVSDRIGINGLANSVIAYEPVWAIGTGKTATPEQAQQVHEFIRGQIARHSLATADKMRILYGGSVKAANAAELFSEQDIDGALVGGASLNANEFAAIGSAPD